MTKRNPSKGPGPEQQNPDALNEIYLAHQVHTLAQILLQQLSRGWQAGSFGGSVGVPPGGVGWNPPGATPPGWQGAPPPIVHWYP